MVARPCTRGREFSNPVDVPRLVLTFYYPWYGNPSAQGGSSKWFHWDGVDEANRSIANSTNYPKLGAYDSHDPEGIAQHCAWAKQAGIDGFIVSWWGSGTFEDLALPRILEACAEAGLATTIYYETVPGVPKTARAAEDDLRRVLERHAGHAAWLKIDRRPVVFIYGRAIGEIGLEGWAKVAASLKGGQGPAPLLIGDAITPEAAVVFDGLHTYNTAGHLRGMEPDQVRSWAAKTYPVWAQTARQAGRISTLTVIPGYDDTKIRKPGLAVGRFGGEAYSVQWEAAIAAAPDWVLITSWNEWHEGSEIEPSVEDGDRYLKLTAEHTARFKAQHVDRPRGRAP